MGKVILSKRLQAVADMVTAGSRVCDVGCDHGFVPIYLAEHDRSPYVLAMDVRQGPLGAAKEHVAERGLDDRIETRLSDGLHNYTIGEADSLICAGMGGNLIMRILSGAPEKTASFRELILQPQSELERFRAWLRGRGYCVIDENMIEEDGKFYPMMRVVPQNAAGGGTDRGVVTGAGAYTAVCGKDVHQAVPDRICDRYGPLLLAGGNETLAVYLKREEKKYEEIQSRLSAEGMTDGRRLRRYEEISALLADCRTALAAMPGRTE